MGRKRSTAAKPESPSEPDEPQREQCLSGLDGSNPLAFLAAVGTLRTATLAMPGATVRLRWQQAGRWRPVLVLPEARTKEQLVDVLHAQLATLRDHAALALADNLNVAPAAYRRYCLEAVARTQQEVPDEIGVAFAASFGCEALVQDTGTPPPIQDTAFRTMSGAGHQHFLGFMRNIVAGTGFDHLRRALFVPWDYADPIRNASLRWDPLDDKRYALRWGNPGADPSRNHAGSMLGANRLALEALPLFPTAPLGKRLATTGFRGRKASDTFLTWPIWTTTISLDVLRSLLSLGLLQADHPERVGLERRGIAEVYRSQRITVGKFRSFTPAEAV